MTKKQEFISNAWLSPVGIELLEEVIHEAIAEHEAGKWNPYPENKPQRTDFYNVTIEGNLSGRIVKRSYWNGAKWDVLNNVIAFRELPEPYDPK